MSFSLCKEDLSSPDVLGEKLMDLAGIVFRKHYYANFDDKEDLISVGVVKALTLIKEGRWAEAKGSLVNYLYAGIRNEMHNYLYHAKKEVCYDKIVEKDSAQDTYFEEETYCIPYSVVEGICSNFYAYGDLSPNVANALVAEGFNIGNRNVQSNEKLKNTYGSDMYNDIIQRLCGAVIWKTQECYH